METITKLKFLRNTIFAIILCPCIVGFLWICWKQISLYLQGFTSVATEFTVDESHFPNVIFCSLKPYNVVFNKSRVSKETYDSITNSVDIKVGIKSNVEIRYWILCTHKNFCLRKPLYLYFLTMWKYFFLPIEILVVFCNSSLDLIYPKIVFGSVWWWK